MMGVQWVVCSVVAALGPVPDLKAPVTLHTNGTTVAEVVRQLRDATKVDLQVGAQVGREVVLLDADKVPADQVMAQLAGVLHGEWAKSDASYHLLVRDTETKRAVAARVARETEQLKTALKFSVDRVKKAQAGGAREGRFARSGSEKFAVLMLEKIPPATLASIAPGARVVFASTRFGVQQQLPAAADSVVRQELAEQAELRRNNPSGPDPEARRVDQTLLSGTYAKAYVVVSRPGWDPVLSVSALAVNSSGDRVVAGATVLTASTAEPAVQENPGGQVRLSQDSQKVLGSIRQGASEREVLAVFSRDGISGSRLVPAAVPTVEPGSRVLFVDPVARDPLSFFVGEAVGQAMPADKPRVALLSDELFESLRTLFGKNGAQVTEVRRRAGYLGYEFVEKDGWATARPNDIDRCMRHRLDRPAFKRLAAQAQTLGAASLDAQAVYAAASPESEGASWDSYYAAAIVGQALAEQVLDARSDRRPALLMYSALPPGQRSQNRVVMPGAAAPNPLGDLVFRSYDGPSTRNANATRGGEQIMFVTGSSGTPMEVRLTGNNSGFERTDVFASVPAQTQVAFTSRTENVLRVNGPAAGQNQIAAPSQLAANRAVQEMRSGAVDKPSAETTYLVLLRRYITVQIDFGGSYSMTRSLVDYAPVPGQSAVPFEQLPDGVQATYQQTYDRMSQELKVVGTDRSARPRRVPPPSPERVP